MQCVRLTIRTYNQNIYGFILICFFYVVSRDVYSGLVDEGIVVEQEEVPPPTVPMDYTWARVSLI